jgi:hypothetical protein
MRIYSWRVLVNDSSHQKPTDPLERVTAPAVVFTLEIGYGFAILSF